MADEDVTAERARLEALAWGAGIRPEDAVRARVALRELDASSASPTPAAPSEGAPVRAVPDRSTDAGEPTVAVPERGGTGAPDGGTATGAPDGGTATGAPDGGTATGAPAERGPGDADGGRGAGLQAGTTAGTATWRTRARGLLWTARPRAWIALGAAAVVGLAFAAGTLVGTSQEQRVAAPSTSPPPGTVTLEELLDVPQTYEDQLPSPVRAPVSLGTTRLVFTNRALDGSSFETPWNVWAGAGTDRGTICLVATANRLESTTACYPREDALHGTVSLSAQSMSGTLTLTVRGGGVQGTVTNEN